MKAKIVTTILMALFLVTLMAFNSSPAMAIDLVPIVDGDVVPFGIPPSSPISTWDTTQIGLVVERGNGFIDVGLPAGYTLTWGIHGLITFHEASVITVKDWDNEGNLGNMDYHDIYSLEWGDDGDANIGTITNPITNKDEVDWTTGGTAVEFWVATRPARDCFRIELDYLSVAASMKIEYVDGYCVSSDIYGLGPQSPLTTYSYGEWLPLVYAEFGVETDLGSCHFLDDVSKVSAGVQYMYEDTNGDGIANSLYLEFQQVYRVLDQNTMRAFFGYFVVISTGDVGFWNAYGTGNWYSCEIWAKAFKKGQVPEGTYEFDAQVGDLWYTGSIQHGHNIGYNWSPYYALVFSDINGTYPEVNTKILNHHTYELPADYRCKIYYVLRSGPVAVAGDPFADIYTGAEAWNPYDGAICYIGEI